MDPETKLKITRVVRELQGHMTKSGRKYCGPYWWGYFMENGKVRRVYIGKELPEDLSDVYNTRTKPPGRTNYSWPGRAKAA